MTDRVGDTAAMLERAAQEAHLPMSGDGRVSEQHAAELLQISQSHLKMLRGEGQGPQFHRVPLAGSRISYRLLDLAQWIESRANDF